MPSLRPGRGAPDRRPRVVVLGDLMLDVVIRPSADPLPGTDVPGRRDAFDAGFLAAWLRDRRARGLRAGRADAAAASRTGALRRAALAGHGQPGGC